MFDKPFRDRILMPRSDRHVVLASITWGIQIEVTVGRGYTGHRGTYNEAYRCLNILSWSYSIAESSPI